MIRDGSDAVAKCLERLRLSPIDVHEWLEGDHQLLSKVPVGCVYPAEESRRYVGAPRRVENIISIIVMLYHGAVQPRGMNQQENLRLTTQVVDYLEADANFGDELVINTFVSRIEHGEVTRTRSKYYATRITLQVTTRFNIGMDYS